MESTNNLPRTGMPRSGQHSKLFWVALTITVVLGVCMVLTCLPSSWGFQGVRNFFDMLLPDGGNYYAKNTAFCLVVMFLIAVVVTARIGSEDLGKTSYFVFDAETPLAKNIAKLCLFGVVGAICVFGYMALSSYTQFL